MPSSANPRLGSVVTVPSLSRRMAEFATGIQIGHLPEAVIDKCKAVTLHGIVSAVAGVDKPASQRLLRVTKQEERSASGSTILAEGSKVTTGGAAFVGSELIHSGGRLDFYQMLTHPGATILPPALAVAERVQSSGAEFVAALAAGYEVQARLARRWIAATQANGFRSSGLFGIFGAVVAAGKLISLTEDELTSAIALAVELAAGNLEGARSGSHSFALHEPNAARNAILAALLAADGVTGSETALDGPAGFYRAFPGNTGEPGTETKPLDFAPETEGLGRDWELLNTGFRVYPIAGYNQAIVDGAARLSIAHDLDWREISAVEVLLNPHEVFYPSPAFRRPDENVVPRVGSQHYFCAWGLMNRGYPLDAARPTPNTRPDNEPQGIDDLMTLVTLRVSADHPWLAPRFSVKTHKGSALEWNTTGREFMYDLATETELIRKLGPTIPTSSSRLDELIEATTRLETLGSASSLIQLTLPS